MLPTDSGADLPWALRWELRVCASTGWQPSDPALDAVRRALAGCDTTGGEKPPPTLALATRPTRNGRRRRVGACTGRRSGAAGHARPAARAAVGLGRLDRRHRVRVSRGGVVQLLEPRKDTRTLAHALLGPDAWLHAEFEALSERQALYAAARAARAAAGAARRAAGVRAALRLLWREGGQVGGGLQGVLRGRARAAPAAARAALGLASASDGRGDWADTYGACTLIAAFTA